MVIGIWDAFQQSQIVDALSAAQQARKDARKTDENLHFEAQRLNAKIDGLALICEALWEVVREHVDITESEIHEKIRQIDLRDGRRDGRISGNPVVCSDCKRPGHTRTIVCMYCGTRLD
jgi:hypothetical protein